MRRLFFAVAFLEIFSASGCSGSTPSQSSASASSAAPSSAPPAPTVSSGPLSAPSVSAPSASASASTAPPGEIERLLADEKQHPEKYRLDQVHPRPLPRVSLTAVFVSLKTVDPDAGEHPHIRYQTIELRDRLDDTAHSISCLMLNSWPPVDLKVGETLLVTGQGQEPAGDFYSPKQFYIGECQLSRPPR